MKRIINGKLYNTNTATLIEEYSYSTFEDPAYFSESLYQKKTGEFFLYGIGGVSSKYAIPCGCDTYSDGEAIIPERDFDVMDWVSDHCDVDTYIMLFGTVEE